MKKSRILMTLHYCLWISLFFTVRAFAYIDVTAVSTLAVASAGVVVACSTAFFIIWRKLKKKVTKTLGIDENANKEVEENIVIKNDVDEEKK